MTEQGILTRVISAAAVLLLVLFTVHWGFAGGNAVLWLMQVVPLVIVLLRLGRDERRPLQWLGFLILFYFSNGVLMVFEPATPARAIGIVMIAVCFMLFTAVILRLKQLPGNRSTTNGQDR